MLDDLLLKLYVMELAEYSLDDVFGKTKEDFKREVDGLSDGVKAGLISSRGELIEESPEVKVYRFYYYDDNYDERDVVYVRITEEVLENFGYGYTKPKIEQVYPHKIEITVYKTTKPGDDN